MSGDDHFIRPDNDVTDPAFLRTIQVFGQGEFVNAEHARNVIGELRRNLRHWREECGKLHAKIKAQKQVEHSLQYEIEGLILRRLHEGRIQGYTMEMAQELASLYFAFRPDKVLAGVAEQSGGAANKTVS